MTIERDAFPCDDFSSPVLDVMIEQGRLIFCTTSGLEQSMRDDLPADAPSFEDLLNELDWTSNVQNLAAIEASVAEFVQYGTNVSRVTELISDMSASDVEHFMASTRSTIFVAQAPGVRSLLVWFRLLEKKWSTESNDQSTADAAQAVLSDLLFLLRQCAVVHVPADPVAAQLDDCLAALIPKFSVLALRTVHRDRLISRINHLDFYSRTGHAWVTSSRHKVIGFLADGLAEQACAADSDQSEDWYDKVFSALSEIDYRSEPCGPRRFPIAARAQMKDSPEAAATNLGRLLSVASISTERDDPGRSRFFLDQLLTLANCRKESATIARESFRACSFAFSHYRGSDDWVHRIEEQCKAALLQYPTDPELLLQCSRVLRLSAKGCPAKLSSVCRKTVDIAGIFGNHLELQHEAIRTLSECVHQDSGIDDRFSAWAVERASEIAEQHPDAEAIQLEAVRAWASLALRLKDKNIEASQRSCDFAVGTARAFPRYRAMQHQCAIARVAGAWAVRNDDPHLVLVHAKEVEAIAAIFPEMEGLQVQHARALSILAFAYRKLDRTVCEDAVKKSSKIAAQFPKSKDIHWQFAQSWVSLASISIDENLKGTMHCAVRVSDIHDAFPTEPLVIFAYFQAWQMVAASALFFSNIEIANKGRMRMGVAVEKIAQSSGDSDIKEIMSRELKRLDRVLNIQQGSSRHTQSSRETFAQYAFNTVEQRSDMRLSSPAV